MSAVDMFGPLIDANDVESAIIGTLQEWAETYMQEYELRKGIPRGTLPRPASWIVSDTDMEREGTDQLPSVVVVSPGLNGNAPSKDGEGNFTAWFTVGIGIFVSSNTRNATKTLLRQYVAIIRWIVLQHQSMGDIVNGVRWMDESYDDNFNFRDDQTISAGQVILDVQVTDLVNQFSGPIAPADPATQPGKDWPLVDAALPKIQLKVGD